MVSGTESHETKQKKKDPTRGEEKKNAKIRVSKIIIPNVNNPHLYYLQDLMGHTKLFTIKYTYHYTHNILLRL